MAAIFSFDNSFARLPGAFFTRQSPVPVAAPRLLALNVDLAAGLGIDAAALASDEGLAILAGNALPEGAEPLAQVYAGHQFAGWVPRLGDGRAILLGEVIDIAGRRRDIQLKGSGRTPYSRGGDGRAWIGPVLREYLVSEAMHALAIPTTRALAAVATGEQIWRENGPLPGAVLTRVAASHLRVGTFQYFAAQGDLDGLRMLTEHVIARHYPQAGDALGLLTQVTERQAELIAAWLSVGFIHGVMNTDNMAVSGETIDYGPCAFMDDYAASRVYSSIDRQGRYAYDQQPGVALWNLTRLAGALLPLMGGEAAIPAAEAALNRFAVTFRAAWLSRFAAKIGIAAPTEPDRRLIESLLQGMERTGADFTNSFRGLTEGRLPAGLEEWGAGWAARIASEQDAAAVMAAANPAIIPRNHRIEAAIVAAVAGDMAPFARLNAALARPFDLAQEDAELALPPAPAEVVHATFCGT